MNTRIALLICGVVLFAGCKKKFDIVPPEVVYMDINGQTEDVVLSSGTFYSLAYQVKDNSGVDHIDIRVRKGFNFETNVYNTPIDFFYGNGFDYDQTVKTESVPFNLPNNVAAGSYRVGILPSDNDNVNGVERFIDFIVVTGKEPVMNVTLSSTSDPSPPVIQARRGDNLKFEGTATSATDISKVKVEMLSGVKSVYSKVIDFPGSADNAIDLTAISDSLKAFVDPINGTGFYKFVIQVIDANGQAAVKAFKVQVVF